MMIENSKIVKNVTRRGIRYLTPLTSLSSAYLHTYIPLARIMYVLYLLYMFVRACNTIYTHAILLLSILDAYRDAFNAS